MLIKAGEGLGRQWRSVVWRARLRLEFWSGYGGVELGARDGVVGVGDGD